MSRSPKRPGYGLTNGQAVSEITDRDEARLVVNKDRVPKKDLLCELYTRLYFLRPGSSPSRLIDARDDRLGEFLTDSYRYYES